MTHPKTFEIGDRVCVTVRGKEGTIFDTCVDEFCTAIMYKVRFDDDEESAYSPEYLTHVNDAE